jgi:hypothetical protein
VAQHPQPAERETLPRQRGQRVARQAQVDGAVVMVRPPGGLGRLRRVAGRDHRHPRHRADRRDARVVVMGLARHPETDARVTGGDLDIPIGLGDQHPDRFEGAVGEEHPEQRHPRHEPRGGEAGGDPDHVLLQPPMDVTPRR